MGAEKKHIASIKYLFGTSLYLLNIILLDNGGNVDKAIFDHFMLWFSPLTKEKNLSGFDIDTIADIVDPTYVIATSLLTFVVGSTVSSVLLMHRTN
jgi:hypothetical protein